MFFLVCLAVAAATLDDGHGEVSLKADENKSATETDTRVVGAIGKIGHRLFTADDNQTYEFSDEDLLGAGMWAKVYKARRIGDPSVQITIKYTLFESNIMGGYEAEALKAVGDFMGQHDNMIAMRYYDAPTMLQYLQSASLTEQEKDFMCALSEYRVQALHRLGFIHHDLKLSNMLVSTSPMDIILIDFSLAEPLVVVNTKTRGNAVNLMQV